MPGTAKATRELTMNDRMLMEKFTMDYDGAPFEGVQLIGNDGDTVQSTWCDNMSSKIFYSEGKMEEGSKQLTMVSPRFTKDDKTGKMKKLSCVHIVTDPSGKEFVFEGYHLMEGDESNPILTMRMTYKRI